MPPPPTALARPEKTDADNGSCGPAYDGDATPYHNPDVENSTNSLAGLHAALASQPMLPESHRRIAIY